MTSEIFLSHRNWKIQVCVLSTIYVCAYCQLDEFIYILAHDETVRDPTGLSPTLTSLLANHKGIHSILHQNTLFLI